jgi:hypothetical protein
MSDRSFRRSLRPPQWDVYTFRLLTVPFNENPSVFLQSHPHKSVIASERSERSNLSVEIASSSRRSRTTRLLAMTEHETVKK